MKTIQSLLVSAALAIGMAGPVHAGFGDPEVIIYRFPGVRADGGPDHTGVATVFHCTNFSGVSENVRIVIRDKDGNLFTNSQNGVLHLSTISMSTKNTGAYSAVNMGTGAVNSGTAAIAATSINVICTAVTIEASSAFPWGVALRGIRFNPVPGSQE